MSEPKFTQGPLVVCESFADNGALSHYEIRKRDTGELVVEVGDPDSMIRKTYDVEKANVTLYSVAGEMYHLLQAICISSMPTDDSTECGQACKLFPERTTCKGCAIDNTLKRARGEANE